MSAETTRTTIAALATAPAPAGIAVIRVSGPKTKTALRALFRSKKDPVENRRTLVWGDLIDFQTGEVIDSALAVYMPGPFSYTGEDIGEFQFHGSPLLVQKMLRSLFAFGVSPAEPGEFTLRAFLNGKLDLVQAEAIGELINATSDQALKIAGDHLKGRFSGIVREIGDPLRDALAEVEASVDFPDEGIPAEPLATLSSTLSFSESKLEELLGTYAYGHVVREGYKVLLCGAPNAGKSSLLNLLLSRERAIVSNVSGTTRDLIEESAMLGGYRFVFCDSAGLRKTSDSVEQRGVELALEKVAWADLLLFVVDASDTSSDWRALVRELRVQAPKIWMVTNKIDLNPNAFASFFCESELCAQNLYLSAKTRAGFDALVQALVEEVSMSLPDAAHANNVVTSERQRNCLSTALAALHRARENIKSHAPIEILAADLRSALESLEELIGKTYNEDILGRIFSKFCIGK